MKLSRVNAAVFFLACLVSALAASAEETVKATIVTSGKFQQKRIGGGTRVVVLFEGLPTGAEARTYTVKKPITIVTDGGAFMIQADHYEIVDRAEVAKRAGDQKSGGALAPCTLNHQGTGCDNYNCQGLPPTYKCYYVHDPHNNYCTCKEPGTVWKATLQPSPQPSK